MTADPDVTQVLPVVPARIVCPCQAPAINDDADPPLYRKTQAAVEQLNQQLTDKPEPEEAT